MTSDRDIEEAQEIAERHYDPLNNGNIYVLTASIAVALAKRTEECAGIAESFATCGCKGKHGRCLEDDPPLAIAAAIRALNGEKPS